MKTYLEVFSFRVLLILRSSYFKALLFFRYFCFLVEKPLNLGYPDLEGDLTSMTTSNLRHFAWPCRYICGEKYTNGKSLSEIESILPAKRV